MNPIFSTEGDYLIMGLELWVPKNPLTQMGGVPEGIADVLRLVDQYISLDLAMGASVNQLMHTNSPIVDELNKGFKLSAAVHVIANLKDAFLKALEAEEIAEEGGMVNQILQMGAPLLMLELGASVRLKFSDLDQVKENLEQLGVTKTAAALYEEITEEGIKIEQMQG